MLIRSAIFWLLFPFVLGQAIRLRKNSPRVSGAAGPWSGAVGTGENLNLIAVGDSIIAGVGASRLDKALVGQTALRLSALLNGRIHWAAVGSIGARSSKVIHSLIPRLPEQAADFIVLSVGVNDVTALSGVSQWMENLDIVLRALRRHSPDAIIAVEGIPPLRGFPLLPQPLRALFGVRGEAFDIACRRVILRHPKAIHVPLAFDPQPDMFSPDGFHPSEESYREFGRITAQLIADKYKADAEQIV